jgi:hypothetical protein
MGRQLCEEVGMLLFQKGTQQLFADNLPVRTPMTKKLESPERAEPQCLELLKELIAAFQRIPQRYCLLCKAKIRLGVEAHRPECPLRRANKLVHQKTSAIP